MLTSYQDVKDELVDNLEQLKTAKYPEDLFHEFADGFVPIYTNDIIEEWQQMPSDFDDSWKDYGCSSEDGIVKRMQIDLYNYYLDQINKAWTEIESEDND